MGKFHQVAKEVNWNLGTTDSWIITTPVANVGKKGRWRRSFENPLQWLEGSVASIREAKPNLSIWSPSRSLTSTARRGLEPYWGSEVTSSVKSVISTSKPVGRARLASVEARSREAWGDRRPEGAEAASGAETLKELMGTLIQEGNRSVCQGISMKDKQ